MNTYDKFHKRMIYIATILIVTAFAALWLAGANGWIK